MLTSNAKTESVPGTAVGKSWKERRKGLSWLREAEHRGGIGGPAACGRDEGGKSLATHRNAGAQGGDKEYTENLRSSYRARKPRMEVEGMKDTAYGLNSSGPGLVGEGSHRAYKGQTEEPKPRGGAKRIKTGAEFRRMDEARQDVRMVIVNVQKSAEETRFAGSS